MVEAARQSTAGLRSYRWSYAYKTSAMTNAGCPVDILHDFYIPVLQRSLRYHRIAGYFRSTSLAVASQGFSAFVGRNGHMRLIVGADLDPADVQAILQGDSERLAMQLNRELERQEAWPEQVTHGVELLAWMVAHGYLDVRVAYAVAVRNSEGGQQARLVTSFGDLQGLHIDETATLTPEVLQPLENKLAELAWKEFEPALAVRRLERANAQAGHAQIALDYLVINSLLDLRKTLAKNGESFWQVLKDIEEIIHGRNRLSITGLPTEIMRHIGSLLLFPVQIPTIGAGASMMATPPLLRAAIDAGYRVADAMKVRRAALRTESIQARLRREIDRELAALHT